MINDDGVKRLASAIVLTALKDYAKALTERDEIEINNLEKFFRGGWYGMLSDFDGEEIIRLFRASQKDGTLKKKVANCIPKERGLKKDEYCFS